MSKTDTVVTLTKSIRGEWPNAKMRWSVWVRDNRVALGTGSVRAFAAIPISQRWAFVS